MNNTVYQRFEAILVIEGPPPNGLISQALTGRNADASNLLEPPGRKYVNIPFEHIRGDVAIVTPHNITVRVFNGKAHLEQKLTVVCREAGTLTQQEIDQLRASGNYIVEWCGKIAATEFRGRGSREFVDGNFIVVREVPSGSIEADDDFQVLSARQWGVSRSADARGGRLKLRILSTLVGARTMSFRTMEEDKEPFVISVMVDTATGELIDGFTPDGTLAMHGLGNHDHVVVASRDSTGEGVSLTGSKAEVLKKLSTLSVPVNLREQAITAIEKFDPSTTQLYVIFEGGKCIIREVPLVALDNLKQSIENQEQEGTT